MKALVTVVSLLIGISGCGSEKVSTGPSRNTVSFVNEVPHGAGVDWIFAVEVPSAHQRFEVGPGETKVVELVADDGSTEFEFTVTQKGTEDTTTGVVLIGQEVEIQASQKREGYRVYVDGEEVVG